MKKLAKALATLLMVGVAAFIAFGLVKTRPRAQRSAPQVQPPLVTTLTARSVPRRISIFAMGTVVPARRLVLQAQVSGKVTARHEFLVPGGTIPAGEEVLRIDSRDYELAVSRRQAEVERAMAELELEAGRRSVAEEEWKLFEEDIPFSEEGRRLALREPQRRKAETALGVARSLLAEAELMRERTIILSPFDALVLEESVEIGQLVTPQSHLATLVGTETYWIQASLPPEKTEELVFQEEGVTEGSRVIVVQQRRGGERSVRSGRLLRRLGDLEPAGRMARVIASVDDPLGRSAKVPFPLLLGSFVHVEIEGRLVEGSVALPRDALREGVFVWVVNSDSRLERRAVTVGWGSTEEIYVTSGLDDGERVVDGSLPAAVEGMPVRTVGDDVSR